MASDSKRGNLGKKNGKRHEGTVLIASTDAGLRRQWMLGLQDAFAIHEVSERPELERAMINLKPTVLLLDSDLPRLDGITGLSATQRLSASTKIVLFAGSLDEREAINALKAGAKGCCKKEIEPPLVRKAVNVVQKGEIWVDRKTTSRLLAELTSLTESHQKEGPSLSEGNLKYLTPRERQIALLISEGACNKEIASRLNVSERTVKAHLSATFQKLQISDRLRLGLFVARHNHVNHAPPSTIGRTLDVY